MMCRNCSNDVNYTVRVVEAVPMDDGGQKLFDTYWCFSCVQSANQTSGGEDSIGASVSDGKPK